MIILQANNVARYFGAELLFNQISMEIQDKDRLALVGRNGSGKSTLLKILAGIEETDEGRVMKRKDVTIGYIEQRTGLISDKTIWEEMLTVFEDVIQLEEKMIVIEKQLSSKEVLEDDKLYQETLKKYDQIQNQFMNQNGYGYESEIRSVLHGFKFYKEDYDRPISQLSGGQKTRLALARLLLEKRDLLILDEPTNHLDIDTLTWLEDYLKGYEGALLIVSHDRYFLDKIVTEVYDLERSSLHHYTGNYTQAMEKKKKEIELQQKNYEKQQAEIKRQEEFIEKNITHASTSKQAQSRRKRLEKMERIQAPTLDTRSANFRFTPDQESGEVVLQISNLTVGYEEPIANNINIDLTKGDIIAIVGPNGVGKSTLLKTIVGQLNPLAGEIHKGTKVDIGYYDQEQQNLSHNETILEELWKDHPHLNEETIRSLLGTFLFSGDDVEKYIHSLSGGEKSRVALAKLSLDHNNTLILDEPTNHLDIESKEVLENALDNFPGTILFVSHDRYFINRMANKVVELESDGSRLFLGDYEYYIEKKQELDELEALEKGDEEENQSSKEITETERDRFELKEKQKETRRLERELTTCEKEITEIDASIQEAEHNLTLPEVYEDPEEAQKWGETLHNLKAEQEKLLEHWETTALELEEYES